MARRKNPVDARGRLDETPFAYRQAKDGTIRISFEGRPVVTVAGRAADRLASGLAAAADERAVQLLLAKATGNFKHGNERR